MGSDFDVGGQVLSGEEEVKCWWSNDNLCVRVQLRRRKVVTDLFYGRDRPVPVAILSVTVLLLIASEDQEESEETDILKLPPTKNFLPILNDFAVQ